MEDESVSWRERKKRRHEWSKCGSLVSGCLYPWPLATHVRTSSSKLSISQPCDLSSPPGARTPRLTRLKMRLHPLSKSNTSHCSLGYWYIWLNHEGFGGWGGGRICDNTSHFGFAEVSCRSPASSNKGRLHRLKWRRRSQSNQIKINCPFDPLIMFQFQEEMNANSEMTCGCWQQLFCGGPEVVYAVIGETGQRA